MASVPLVLGGCFESNEMVAPSDTESATATDTGSTGGRTSLTSTDGGSSPTSEDTGGVVTMTTATTDASTTAGDATATTNDSTDGVTTGTGDPPPGDCNDFDGTIAYINFDGASLRGGAVDNAPAGVTENAALAGDWAPYGADDAEMVFALMQPHWAPFDICLTMQPPQTPDYEMVVVQSEPYDDNDNILSLIGPDCENTASNNVNVLFLSDGLNLPEITKAIAISKHLAHLFGLDDVGDDGDLMNQFVAMTLNGASFTNTCHPLIGAATCAGGVDCAQGQQDAHEMLSTVLGVP